MQTHPPSIGNNVKLNPLDVANESKPYNFGFVNLKSVEPSLGIPTGYTLTQPNSVYFFPVFGISNSYINSRKFTGVDSLVLVNKNIGYNTINPVYNIDISGDFHALSAYIEVLSANKIVPANGSNALTFNFKNVYFETDVYLNKQTFIKDLTANTLFAEFLSAKKEITTTIYTIYYLTGAYVDTDVTIGGSITATNIFGRDSIRTPFLSAISAFFFNLTSNHVTVTNTLSVQNDLYANKIFGQVNIDPFSQLYYNNKNELSISQEQNYVFAVRPSDDYSTDDISIPRTRNGLWWSDYGNIHEDGNVLKPYFKNLQPVFDYVYKNGIYGNNLTIYIDEDIIEGEQKPNYFTTDKSGSYGGCTTTGNLTAGFYSTEWLGANYPYLTAAGLSGGDFLWGYDPASDMNGVFSYIDVPPVKFKNIDIHGRWDIGPLTRTNNTSYYTLSGRRFIDPPRKISFRSYVCGNPRLGYGTFTDKVSTWTEVRTKATVQGRQVSFKHDTNLSLNNLCFEFNTNANDSTALVFYNGQSRLSNITVALLGKGIYSYGALNATTQDTYVQVCGNFLGDPTRFTPSTWNNLVFAGYNYETPNIYPGYGLAVVGNPSILNPTLISFGPNTEYTGFINVNNGAMFDLTDYNVARKTGRYSYLQSSVILDGKFNAYAYYQIGNNSTIQGTEHLFATDNLAISSFRIASNNIPQGFNPPSYQISIFEDPKLKYNFKYINFAGTFSILNLKYYGYTNWAFNPRQGITPAFRNSYLNIFNNNITDGYYKFNINSTPPIIDLANSLISVGYLNRFTPTQYNTESTMRYVGISELFKYQNYYNLTSPFDVNQRFTLNYYTSSTR